MSFDCPTPSYSILNVITRVALFSTPPSHSKGRGLVDVQFADAQLIDVDVYNQVKAVIPTQLWMRP